MFQQAFYGGDKRRVSRLASAVKSAPHWKIAEAAVHSALQAIYRGGIDKKSQQRLTPTANILTLPQPAKPKNEFKIHTAFMHYPRNMVLRAGEPCFQKLVSNLPSLPFSFSPIWKQDSRSSPVFGGS
jgi:hypothetical protein